VDVIYNVVIIVRSKGRERMKWSDMTPEQRKRKKDAEALYSMAYYEFINNLRTRESLQKLRDELMPFLIPTSSEK